jgi:P27 family predicted phage terminase small subunit
MPRGRPRKSEPAPAALEPTAAPECPAYLGTVAKKKWAEVVAILAAFDLLRAADADAIAMYCAAFERWRAAEAKLKKGLVITGKKGTAHTPFMAISNRAKKEMQQLARVLGLTPDARRKMGVKEQRQPAANPKLRFFAGREETA